MAGHRLKAAYIVAILCCGFASPLVAQSVPRAESLIDCKSRSAPAHAPLLYFWVQLEKDLSVPRWQNWAPTAACDIKSVLDKYPVLAPLVLVPTKLEKEPRPYCPGIGIFLAQSAGKYVADVNVYDSFACDSPTNIVPSFSLPQLAVGNVTGSADQGRVDSNITSELAKRLAESPDPNSLGRVILRGVKLGEALLRFPCPGGCTFDLMTNWDRSWAEQFLQTSFRIQRGKGVTEVGSLIGDKGACSSAEGGLVNIRVTSSRWIRTSNGEEFGTPRITSDDKPFIFFAYKRAAGGSCGDPPATQMKGSN